MISKITSSEVFHGHIEVFSVLEGGDHVDNEGVAELLKDSLLVDNWANTFFKENPKYIWIYFALEISFMA